MRWISALASLLLLTGLARAAGPDDQYLDIYNEILQADNLQQNGHAKEAAAKYLEAQKSLIVLKETHPTWNTEVVSFRLDYLSEQLQALAKAAPVAPTPAPVAAVPAKPASEVENLQEQLRSLAAANGALENKLKEALSVQPAAVSPHELAKAEEKITALQKEKDLLSVALEQAKAAKPTASASPDAEKTSAQLAEANQALAALKARSAEEAKSAQADIDQLKASLADDQKKIATDAVQMEALKLAQAGTVSSAGIVAERDKLKEELGARTRDLADAEARRDQNAVELRAQLADMQKQRDELQTKLAAAATPIPPPVAPAAAVPAAADGQVDQLRARLAVLEAQPVPFTPEELAVLNKNPSPLPVQDPALTAERKHVIRSKKDLPAGTAPLMDEATIASRQRDFAKAAKLFQEILNQDENNVFVLGHLANAQLALGQVNECEKTATRTLALDPEDPVCLQILGVLRYQQKRLDEALNALSLSAKYVSTNEFTQYYLGRVLAEKGLRAAAETAFRKALEVDPTYADAHYSLAFLYAVEKPPSLALARWHYQRAVDLGREKSQEMEKLLTPSP